MHKQRAPHYTDFLLLPLLYYLGAKAGVALTVMPEGMAILWPPNSVLLATLIALHGRGFLLFAALALGAEIAADVPTFQLHEAFLFGLVNIGEATIAWGLLTRWHFHPRFAALHDCVKFVVAGPLMSAFVAACCGALIYSAFRGTETSYFEFLRIWWFGDALGLMIITPLLLSVWSQASTDTPRPPVFRLADGLVGLAALVALGLLIASRDGVWLGMHVGPVIILPFVIFVAARCTLSWTAVTVAAVTLVVVTMMTSGRSPFGSLPPRDAVIQAQEFIFIMSLLALGLTALLSQLRAHQSALESANTELQRRAEALEHSNIAIQRTEAEVVALNVGLEHRVQERTRELAGALAQVKSLQGLLPMCAWCKKIRDDQDYWHAVEKYIADHTEAQISHGICPECLAKEMRALKGHHP
jgi:integral membrane sensor domain MASE1